MKTVEQYLTSESGIERSRKTRGTSNELYVSPYEGFFGYMPANALAAMESLGAGGWGGWAPYDSNQWTRTLDNSSTVTYGANGLVITTNATPTTLDDAAHTSKAAQAFVRNLRYKAIGGTYHSGTTHMGLMFGFVTSSTTEGRSTAPADGVWLHKVESAAAVVGRVVENTNAAVDQALGSVTATTWFRVGVEFWLDDPTGSATITSAHVKGGFWFGTRYANTFYPFTSAQKTAVAAMFNTTAPTLAFHCNAWVNGTTQRTFIQPFTIFDMDLIR